MHRDEIRDPRQIEELRIVESTSDPLKTYSTIQKALKDSKTGGEKAKDWQRERNDLKRRISAAHEALNTEKKTVAELERHLKLAEQRLAALRNSSTMKAGKVVAAPYQYSNKVKLKAKRILKTQVVNFNSLAKKRGQGVENASGRLQTDANAKTSTRMFQRQLSTEELLNDAWYNRGAVTEAFEILQKLGDDTSELSEKGLILKRRVEGAYRLYHEGVSVPSRLKGCAYTPEKGRVMYTVHSTPVFNSNGYSTRTRGVAEGIRNNGGDVVVVARSGYPWDSASDIKKPAAKRFSTEINGISYVHTPGGNLNRDSLDHYILKAADSYVREAKLLRPSIIQSASNHRTALPALIAARRVGVPFVYEVRGLWEITELSTRPGLKGTERFAAQVELETLVAKEADVVLAITEQVADELVKRGVHRDNIQVAPNAVDPHEFMPLPLDTEYAKSKKFDPVIPTLGFAGSIVEYEGLATLLDASAILTSKGISHQVVIAGSGGAEASLKEQTKQLKLKNVYFLGRLPQSEIPRLMSTFTAVVCPRVSNEITELVSPLKPLESFASATPTVLSDVAPNIDLAGPESSRALLFEAGNADSLAVQLQDLLEDKQRAVEMARRARLWTVRDRQWNIIGKLMLDQHRVASARFAEAAIEGKPVHRLKVALISDEFTAATLAGTFDIEKLGRSTWREQIQATPFDLIFVESAWAGNEGEWERGIGFYSDEESADLRGVLGLAKDKAIPTVFWNKEDPVHFSRFAPNAVLFDHVATTDANMVEKYLSFPGSVLKTASALPFYAQPTIHNPLRVERKIRDTVAYAGTYYGERYAERSRDLEKLLAAALPHGLEIYDRQANNPESPYKFPMRYRDSVKGAIPYDEVIESYKTHVAHLNVNSVTNSPTMFSRRVIEIPASGGLVLSSAGRGILETLGNTIAVSNDSGDFRAFLHSWATDADARLREIWLQMRTIYRAHTADTALTVLCRSLGLQVSPAQESTYGIRVNYLNVEIARAIVKQSVLPVAVFGDSSEEDAVRFLQETGIEVSTKPNEKELKVDYVGNWVSNCHRTYYEDLLIATKFGDWDFIRPVRGGFEPSVNFVAEKLNGPIQEFDLVKSNLQPGENYCGVSLHMLDSNVAPSLDEEFSDDLEELDLVPGTRVLIAGHDLKFVQFLIDELEDRGIEIDIDQWSGHAKHNEEVSAAKLELADVVFCEWGLGNAVWYSNHLARHQRMIVRVHSQELKLPYLRKINHSKVDKYIFVGEMIKNAAIISHGLPEEKCFIVPNAVPTAELAKRKTTDAKFGIGFVGMVPYSKRIDSAIDLLELLQEKDSRFHLRIKGKLPSGYPWMKDRKDEMKFYEEQFKRIEHLNERNPGSVIFDGFGSDMADWYSKVGIVVSVSDFESFHLTIADGAASGALPVSIAWDGADLIYPHEWLVSNVGEMAEHIIEWDGETSAYAQFVQDNFEQSGITDRIVKLMAG